MAVTTAVLSGNITDITGALTSAYLKRVVVVIEANTDGSLLLDTDGNRIMAGPKRVAVDTSAGTYSVTLPKTDSTDIIPDAPGRLYRVRLIYPSGIPGAGNISQTSGWWELTADGSLSDADKWPGLEVTAVSDELVDSIAALADDAEAAALAAEAAQAAVEAVVATTDGLMTAVDANDASAFRVQQDARLVDTINTTLVHLAGDYAGATDSDKIIAAIAAASAAGGGVVRLNRRASTTVWDLNGAPVGGISVPSNITIDVETGVTLNVTGAVVGVAVFTAAGTEGTKTALTANAAAGSLSAALPTGQGANFTPGDLIAFEADVAIFGATSGRPREIQRIVKISTDTVYFSTPLLDSYNTADSATFSKVTPVKNITFRGLRFTNPNPTTNTGYVMRFQLCEGIRVEDFVFTDMGGSIELRDCIDSSISDGTVDRLRNYGSSYGYGVDLVGACSSINVDRIRGRSVRHLFTTLGLDRSGVLWGYPKHIIVSNCIGTGDVDSLSIFDTHEAGRDITFNNCVAIGGGTSCSGFQMRAKNVKLNNCTADRNGLRGLNTTLDATGLRVNGGHYTRAATNGMSLQANDTQVIGAEIGSSGNAGVVVLTGLTGVIIKANIITDSGAAGSAGYGIHDQGATGAVYDGNIIPKSTTQVTSILSLQATSVASNNICMGYGANSYGFTSANASAIRRGNNGDSGTEFSGDVNVSAFFRHSGTQLGLFGATATTKKTITGSRGGNAALASLLTLGALMGYWTDGTTA